MSHIIHYAIISEKDKKLYDIITQDGGVALLSFDEQLIVTLYYLRISKLMTEDLATAYTVLGEGNVSEMRSPNYTDIDDNLVKWCLNWLCMGTEPITFKEIGFEKLKNLLP